MEEEDSVSEDYDSVEEVISEPSSTEETSTSLEGLQLHSSRSLQKEASEDQDAGRCSGLDSGAVTVLEYKQDQSSKSLCVILLQYCKNSLTALFLRESLQVCAVIRNTNVHNHVLERCHTSVVSLLSLSKCAPLLASIPSWVAYRTSQVCVMSLGRLLIEALLLLYVLIEMCFFFCFFLSIN